MPASTILSKKNETQKIQSANKINKYLTSNNLAHHVPLYLHKKPNNVLHVSKHTPTCPLPFLHLPSSKKLSHKPNYDNKTLGTNQIYSTINHQHHLKTSLHACLHIIQLVKPNKNNTTWTFCRYTRKNTTASTMDRSKIIIPPRPQNDFKPTLTLETKVVPTWKYNLNHINVFFSFKINVVQHMLNEIVPWNSMP